MVTRTMLRFARPAGRRAATRLLFAVALGCAALANAQTWPAKPVRLVIPFAAGAGTDVVARTVTQKAQEFLGQPIVADNRAGAAGNLGAEVAAKAAPDGYTLAILSTIHAANQSFYRRLGYAMATDFVPVVEVGVSPTLWVVRPDLPVASIDELARYARANPGKLTYGSGGASHPAELFRALTGTDITIVPYKGVSAVMTDLLAGRVDMSVAGYLDTNAHVRSGKLKALATTNPRRLPQLPGIPPMGDTLPGYDFTLWYGLFAPTGTPPDAVAKVRSAVERALETPEVLERFQGMGLLVAKSSSAEFAGRVRAEIQRWSDTVKKAGIQPQDP
jgi:tripartite-type tricarboxylate transporter receptor subunit TctC